MENCVIYTTVPNEFTANLIATTLIDEKLAACISIIPQVKSVYRWNDSIQTDEELLLMIKTRTELYDKAEHRIKELHENSLPEIIALPIVKGSNEYQNWIVEETK